ncbi:MULTISPECIES: ribonuclease domain-containing protein [unclassified Lysobacter]|uniref:ribonuclease domain-containing protein n=1 Tax=unclassified Lysobacter TaxID=2635362 RepID=UPI001C21DEEB|nr:ribonuclease domain-containing protein [Lysobacter sp. MMG2]MBU8978227.1 hypothetical protein [Lysobacter sp. MMG2]
MNTTHTRAALAVLPLLLAAMTVQAKVPECGRLPTFVREAERNLAYCITTDAGAADCRAANVEAFANNEGRLPAAGRGQAYRAGRAQHPQADPPGRNRVVFLVTEGQRKPIIEARYFTSDHYATFCSL